MTTERPLTFAKLRGSENYREWERAATLALMEASLWGNVYGEKEEPAIIKATEDDSPEQQEN